MPSVAESLFTCGSMSPFSSKKRRREEGSTVRDEIQMKLSASPRYLSKPLNQYDETKHTPDRYMERERKYLYPTSHRAHHDTKRQRFSVTTEHGELWLAANTDHTIDSIHDLMHEDAVPSPAHTQTTRSSPKKKHDISPCHICHRKPTQKKELDSYADCEGCGGRTCWICFRECAGLAMDTTTREKSIIWEEEGFRGRDGEVEGKKKPWERGRPDGHRAMVCSRCCVERGTEGEVCCLGCLSAEGWRGEEGALG